MKRKKRENFTFTDENIWVVAALMRHDCPCCGPQLDLARDAFPELVRALDDMPLKKVREIFDILFTESEKAIRPTH